MRKSTFELHVALGLYALAGAAIGACHDDGEPQRPGVSGPVFPVLGGEAGAAPESGASPAVEAGAAAPGGSLEAGVAEAGVQPDQLPCDVASFLAARCASCHGAPPLPGIPMALTSYADLAKRSQAFPNETYAQRAAQRVQMGTMPPGGGLNPAEVQRFVGWVQAGAQPDACGAPALDATVPPQTASDAGAAGDAGAAEAGTDDAGVADGQDASPGDAGQAGGSSSCSSGKHWSKGDAGSPLMTPGQACLGCHSAAATYLSFAGTLYLTAHEPDQCYGALVNGASILIKGADGRKLALTPNSAGNFFTQSAVAKPYTVEVHYQGRVLTKTQPQTNGDCNTCHSEAGASGAAGRIVLP